MSIGMRRPRGPPIRSADLVVRRPRMHTEDVVMGVAAAIGHVDPPERQYWPASRAIRSWSTR